MCSQSRKIRRSVHLWPTGSWSALSYVSFRVGIIRAIPFHGTGRLEHSALPLLRGTSCRTFTDSARQLRGVSLCQYTQVEFALPARDFGVEASVSGWNNRLQQSPLAAPGCPACTPGWTRQLQGMCTIGRFIVFLVLWLCIGAIPFSRDVIGPLTHGRRSGASFAYGDFGVQVVSGAPLRSRGNAVTHRTNPDILRNPFFLNFRPFPWKDLVGRICVARTRLLCRPKRFFRKLARVRQTYFPLSPRTSDILCVVLFSAFRFSKLSPRKIPCGSILRCPQAASASIQEILLEKGIHRSTFTNRPCRPDLASVRALSYSFLTQN